MGKQKYIAIKFTVPQEKRGISTEAKGLAIRFDGEDVCINIYYTFKDIPLTLRGMVACGDEVELVIFNHRIELWIGSYLADEEWPFGECIFNDDSKFVGNLDVNIQKSFYTKESESVPAIISSFKNAEGWRPDKNIFVGDCMPYAYNGKYHIIYLKDRHHHKSKWGLGAHQWEHISTKDFENFDIHPTMVAIDETTEGSICTGSWIARNDIHYLYYTVRMADGSDAPIRRSISHDGYHYKKDVNFSFILSEKYHRASARDPKVILGEDGIYHMFLTTSLQEQDRGCLAHLTSTDMEHWAEEKEPIYVSSDTDQPECPDYIKYGDYYYLIFSHRGIGKYIYSKKPFDAWQIPANPIIPCESVPKCAIWKDKLVFSGFKCLNGYGGTLTFKSAVSDKNGELLFL